jgi:diguanylate cyclase (GGDEF)-like protein
VVERDDLTGALNRRGLANRLNEERSRAARSGGSITLFMGDIDNFKQFNEDYGYLVGDCVLQSVHYAISSALRKGDHEARWSGDEMAGYLVDTTADDIENIRENIPNRMSEKIPYALGHLLPDEFSDKKEELSEKLKITLEFTTVDPNDLPKDISLQNIESIYKSVMAKEQVAKRDKKEATK